VRNATINKKIPIERSAWISLGERGVDLKNEGERSAKK
jgi:hypothetical protein